MRLIMSGGDGLNELLQSAEQLKADMDVSGLVAEELPRVDRNLHQILEAGQQLWARTQQGAHQDVRASILLGSKGYDLPKVSQKLKNLSTAKTFEPIKPIRDLDVTGFLKNERENTILTAIEETKKNTYDEAERKFWESRVKSWEEEKQEILHAFVRDDDDPRNIWAVEDPHLTDMSMNKSTYDLSLRASSSGPVGPCPLNSEELAYAAVVEEYNKDIITGSGKFNFIEKFTEVAKKFNNSDVDEMWSIVSYMSDLPIIPSRCLQEPPGSSMRLALISQAKAYLQDGFRRHMELIVGSKLAIAQVGGVPGTIPLVKGYLRVRLNNYDGLLDGYVMGLPLWPLVYCCLRCGDLDAALSVLEQAGPSVNILSKAVKELQQSPDQKVGCNTEAALHLAYKRSVRTCTDPYQRIVYCIIGGCDITDDHSEVCTSTQDWLWVKLCQIREGGSNGERLTHCKLQSMLIDDYGESHFKAYENPWVYSCVLFLTGQFEVAIEFLSRIEHLRCHSVHAALSLHELHLLRVATNEMSALICREGPAGEPVHTLNLARLISLYTRKFELTNCKEALQYFYFLRDVYEDEDMFAKFASKLVLESKKVELLLGSISSNGTKVPGYLDRFKTDTSKIAVLVAKDAEEKGLFEDAVQLYDLAREHENALLLLNRLMSQLLCERGREPEERVLGSARILADRMSRHGHNASPPTATTFYLLLDLASFFQQHRKGQYSESLDTLEQLKLIPLTEADCALRVESFKNLKVDVVNVIPEVILSAMSAIAALYKNIKSSNSLGENELKSLKKKAQCLIYFAGSIPYRVPGDISARLIQTEALMG